MDLRKISSSKRADMTAGTIIALIIGAIVLISAITFFMSPRILEKLKLILSDATETPGDVIEELTPDELRILKYQYVGKVIFERQDQDFVNHYYIYLFDIAILSEEDCKTPGYEYKKACYDVYGLFNNIKDVDCTPDKGLTLGSACFSSTGRLIKTKKQINTKLYWDWDSGNNGDGELMLSNKGKNLDLGFIKNNRFEINLTHYNEAEETFLSQGVDKALLNNLHLSKYLKGGIYKYDFDPSKNLFPNIN